MSDYEHEEWKDIPGYETHYQVSNLGRVRSFRRGSPKILKPGKTPQGYPFVNLCVEAENRSAAIHTLVANTFLGGVPKGMVVNHISGCITDSRVSNLEIVTPYENIHHAMETLGTMKGTKQATVERIIHLLNTTHLTLTAIAKECGVSYASVSHIMNGKRWRHMHHLVTPEAKARRAQSAPTDGDNQS